MNRRTFTTHKDFEKVPALQLLRRMFGYMRPYRARWLTSMFLFVLSAIQMNMHPLVDRILLDDYIAIGRRDGFVGMLLIAAGLHLFHQLLYPVRQILLGRAGHRTNYDLRHKLFTHVHSLSLSFFERVPVGSVMTRFLSDLTTFGEFMAWQAATFVHDSTLALVTLAAMFWLDWQLALVVCATLPPLIIVGVLLRPRIHHAYETAREFGSQLNVFLAENISGMRVIQSFVREQVNQVEFARKNNDVVSSTMKVAHLNAWFPPVVELTRAAALCGVLYAASVLMGRAPGGSQGALTVGVLVAFTAYINILWAPINTITSMYVLFQGALTSATRAFAILDTDPSVKDSPTAQAAPRLRGHVSFDHVTFGYDPQRPVLQDICLDIAPGQMVALVGHTGSGKTTISALLARFYDVDAGAVRIDGVDVRSLTQRSLRASMGVVVQEPYIFGDTVANNIRYGRPDAGMDEVIAASKLANVHDFITTLGDGYETFCKERGSQFSGGQRQLISIARAILANPRILIFDEATSAVDTQTEARIQQALDHLLHDPANPRTSVVIAHRLSTIRNADLIVVLDAGRIIERGTHSALLARGGAYAALIAAQAA